MQLQAPLGACVAVSSQKINLPNLSTGTKYRPTPLKCGIRRDSKDTHFPSPTGTHPRSSPELHDANMGIGTSQAQNKIAIVAASSSSNTQEMTEYKSTDVLCDKGSRSTLGPTASGVNSGMNLSNTKSGGATHGSTGDFTVSNGTCIIAHASLHLHHVCMVHANITRLALLCMQACICMHVWCMQIVYHNNGA